MPEEESMLLMLVLPLVSIKTSALAEKALGLGSDDETTDEESDDEVSAEKRGEIRTRLMAILTSASTSSRPWAS